MPLRAKDTSETSVRSWAIASVSSSASPSTTSGCSPRRVLLPAICDLQGDFDEMQGEPIQFLAESHCAVRSSEDSSLSKEQGGASGIAGKSRVANWLVAGITDDCGPPHLRQAARRNVVAVERLAGLAGLDAGAARHHAGSRVLARLDAGAARHRPLGTVPASRAPRPIAPPASVLRSGTSSEKSCLACDRHDPDN
jgi:hypothetical protein